MNTARRAFLLGCSASALLVPMRSPQPPDRQPIRFRKTARHVVAPKSIDPERRRRTLARFDERLQAAGLSEKIRAAWLFAATEVSAANNNVIGEPSLAITEVSNVSFEEDAGFRFDSCKSSLTLPVKASDLDAVDFHVGVLLLDGVAPGMAPVLEAVDETTHFGLSINPRSRQHGTVDIMCGAQSVSIKTPADTDGSGFIVISRQDGFAVHTYRNGILLKTNDLMTEALPDVTLRLRTSCSTQLIDGLGSCVAYVTLGFGMTDEEVRSYYAIIQSTVDAIRYGEITSFRPGQGPTLVEANVVIYGTTPSGILAAYEARRQGRSTVIIGGWRDRTVGGMMSGGLGASDIMNPLALGGLPAATIARIQDHSGDDSLSFEPRFAQYVFASMLDPSRPGGQDVPIYWSDGVRSVSRLGDRIVEFKTVDGRVVAGSVFIDCSYEGDLMARSGVTYSVGREDAGGGVESLNGYRGTETASFSGNHQFLLGTSRWDWLHPSRRSIKVDPFRTPGDPTSGLLPGLQSVTSAIVGEGDAATLRDRVVVTPSRSVPKTQAYNFRLTMTDLPRRRVPLPTARPENCDPARYEALLRWIDATAKAGIELDVRDLFLINRPALSPGVYDVNARGGFSTDPFGLSWSYPEADYREREEIWKAHETYARGLLWTLQHSSDPRLPTKLRDETRQLGLDNLHYLDPHVSDEAFWPPQLYIRESRRMVGALVWTGDDIAETGPLRSNHTIGVASYAVDSHHVQSIPDDSTGRWRIWNEGNFEDQRTGGPSRIAPIPYEVIVPRRQDCTNILVTFCVSATHVAFGAIRMELTAMALGQAAGLAAALALERPGLAVQDVAYSELRERLFAASTTFHEPKPVLPMTHGLS